MRKSVCGRCREMRPLVFQTLCEYCYNAKKEDIDRAIASGRNIHGGVPWEFEANRDRASVEVFNQIQSKYPSSVRSFCDDCGDETDIESIKDKDTLEWHELCSWCRRKIESRNEDYDRNEEERRRLQEQQHREDFDRL